MKTFHVYEYDNKSYKEYWSCDEDRWHYLGNWYADSTKYAREANTRLNGWHVEINPRANGCPSYNRVRAMTEQEYLEFAEICLLI